jgi:hypothetical protein
MTLAGTAAQAVVKTATGSSINAGIWTLVGVIVTTIVTTIGLVWVAYIKQLGPWKKVANDARDADFTRLRLDITRQDERIAKLEGLVAVASQAALEANERAIKSDAAAEAHAVRADAKLQTTLTACEILLSLVEREIPQPPPEIALVKRLLAQAAADDLGVGAGMRALATIRGVGE